jgi:hypothetical protein
LAIGRCVVAIPLSASRLAGSLCDARRSAAGILSLSAGLGGADGIIHVDLDGVEWTPGSAYKGPDALYQGQEVFYRKVLICPPPGRMVKTVAVARSEEHVFNLRGGRVNKSGKPTEAPGNSDTLNATGQPVAPGPLPIQAKPTTSNRSRSLISSRREGRRYNS